MLPNDKEQIATAKYNANGEVMYFPGNTFLCHLPKESALFNRLNSFYGELNAFNDKHKIIALLPVDSYHMTIFDAVSEINGEFSFPKSLSEPSLEKSTEYIKNRIIEEKLETTEKTVRVIDIKYTTGTIGLLVQGYHAHELALRNLRDTISNIIGIRKQDHDEYLFHITLAYFTNKPTQKQEAELKILLNNFYVSLSDTDKMVTLGKAEFCTFDNMERFTPIYIF